MNKLTKIIATIGPSTDNVEMIEKIIKGGVNVFRFNFKHNTAEWHNERIMRVNNISEKLNTPIGTLIDLQGPEIRINFKGETLEIQEGEKILLHERVLNTDEKGITITHPDIIPHIQNGQNVIIDDGAFTFTLQVEGEDRYLVSHSNGVINPRKSMNLPGADFPIPVLVDRDLEGLALAAKQEVDFVALSFVRSVEDLRITRAEMKKINLSAKLIAKIETRQALDNLDAIIEESDGIMVARGDLGVEMPIEQVPYYQKIIIQKCLEKSIPVITATQMLQSMIDSPYPTRAEISDIANATFDLTDAVMLSGETANGQYPLEVIRAMEKTVTFNEKLFAEDRRIRFNYSLLHKEAYLCDAAYNLYLESKIDKKGLKGFLIFTQTGQTVRLVSRYRPSTPIFAFTPSKFVADNLTLNFGVHPFIKEVHEKREVSRSDICDAIEIIKKQGYVEEGDTLIVLHGDVWGEKGGTSTVRFVTVE